MEIIKVTVELLHQMYGYCPKYYKANKNYHIIPIVQPVKFFLFIVDLLLHFLLVFLSFQHHTFWFLYLFKLFYSGFRYRTQERASKQKREGPCSKKCYDSWPKYYYVMNQRTSCHIQGCQDQSLEWKVKHHQWYST